MNILAISIGGLGKNIVCIGNVGITKVGEYVTGMCTLWLFWL